METVHVALLSVCTTQLNEKHFFNLTIVYEQCYDCQEYDFSSTLQ